MRSKWILLAVMLILCTLAMTGCGGGSDASLDENDNGSQITLRVGQALTINLEGNPTTGYTWEVERVDEAVLRQVGDIEFNPSSSALGSPGTQTLHFEAAAAGETDLFLVYHRPWESEDPLETFSVHVIVQ